MNEIFTRKNLAIYAAIVTVIAVLFAIGLKMQMTRANDAEDVAKKLAQGVG